MGLFYFFFIFFIIILSEFFLISGNVFFQNKEFTQCSNLDFIKKITNIKIDSKYLQLLKLFADFKYFLIIFLGTILSQKRGNRTIRILYYLSIVICLILGVIKGQKSVIILTVIFYFVTNFENIKHNYKKKLKKIFFQSFLFLFLLTFFVRLIAHLRNYFHLSSNNECETYSISEIGSLMSTDLTLGKSFYLVDFFVTRLNYLIPFSKISEYVENIGSINGVQYLSNIFGLVPRFFGKLNQ